MWETYRRKNSPLTVIGRIDEASKNLEYVFNEVKPVVYTFVKIFFMVSYQIHEYNRRALCVIQSAKKTIFFLNWVCGLYCSKWMDSKMNKQKAKMVLLLLIDPFLNPKDWPKVMQLFIAPNASNKNWN